MLFPESTAAQNPHPNPRPRPVSSVQDRSQPVTCRRSHGSANSIADHKLVDERVEHVARVAVSLELRALAKPAHGVQSVALKDVAAVEDAIVVAQQHVAGLHRHADDILLAHPVDLVEHLAGDQREVAKVDVRHAHLGHGARPAVAQETRVVVDVAEPQRPARLGVAVDGLLRVLDRLQPHRPAVRAPDHVEVHVELGRHLLSDEATHLLHQLLLGVARRRAEHVEVEVGHRDAHLAVEQRAQDVGGHVAEDLLTVCDHELAARDGGRLEADERASGRRLLVCRLVV
mmetsp:Transcript_59296/g.162694  ORF Transcript_59296/g.162694 Transcript_59296/m.162694 type:complete len:287 (-) Transcript_59296:586-1446(-)